jgi:transglutaminase-like putative cysteine protease
LVYPRAISAMFVLAILCGWSGRAEAGAPDWLRNLSKQPARHYADDVNAVALFDDTETTVKDNGEIVTYKRVAFRILRPEGKHYGTYALYYDNETKIKSLHGWSITAKGLEYESKEKDSIERSAAEFEIYSDVKERLLSVSGAEAGAVVGFEYERKERPYLFASRWYFQDTIPVEHARYALRLPQRWEFKPAWENHSEVQPLASGDAYVWELTDIPRIESEYRRPTYRALAGHMTVTYFSERTKNQTYKSWSDIGLWYSRLAADAQTATPALQQKALELAPAGLPPLERIRALARFAQHDIRYAAIEIGIGGYKPHAAGEILEHRYGDCKDKVTLMGSLLAQIGVKSYYVLVHDERGIFKEDSPPDIGFDHVIIAIRIPDEAAGKFMPAVYDHPKLGRLLIFDPTQELVPFGNLPVYEQDNYGLLVTGEGGELIHLPLSAPELNQLQRKAKLKLLPDGVLEGEIEEVRSGYLAMLERTYLRDAKATDRKKTIEHFLGAGITEFQVDGFELLNVNDIDKDLILRFKFTAPHYAKSAGPLVLVRPCVVGEEAGYFDPAKPRLYPYEFAGLSLATDLVEIALPEGFRIDELPDPASADFPFGRYVSKTEISGNMLTYTREYKRNATLVPVNHFDDLQHFFSQITADEKSMAVLKRSNGS